MAIGRGSMSKELFGGKKAPAKGSAKPAKPGDKKLPPWLNKPKGGKK